MPVYPEHCEWPHPHACTQDVVAVVGLPGGPTHPPLHVCMSAFQIYEGGQPVADETELKLFHDLNADGVITDDDLAAYLNTVLDAFSVHIERERVRHGLWKEYPAAEQMRMIKLKIERGMRMLEIDPHDQAMTDSTVEELLDCINYAVFGIRLLKGQV